MTIPTETAFKLDRRNNTASVVSRKVSTITAQELVELQARKTLAQEGKKHG